MVLQEKRKGVQACKRRADYGLFWFLTTKVRNLLYPSPVLPLYQQFGDVG